MCAGVAADWMLLSTKYQQAGWIFSGWYNKQTATDHIVLPGRPEYDWTVNDKWQFVLQGSEAENMPEHKKAAVIFSWCADALVMKMTTIKSKRRSKIDISAFMHHTSEMAVPCDPFPVENSFTLLLYFYKFLFAYLSKYSTKVRLRVIYIEIHSLIWKLNTSHHYFTWNKTSCRRHKVEILTFAFLTYARNIHIQGTPILQPLQINSHGIKAYLPLITSPCYFHHPCKDRNMILKMKIKG